MHAAELEPSPRPAAAPRPRVLVVGRDPGLFALASVELRRRGMDPAAADGAFEARRHLASSRVFDAVLIDLDSDGADGFSLLEELARSADAPQVIAVVDESARDVGTRAMERGAFDFVEKPVRWPLCGERLRRALLLRRLQQASLQPRVEEPAVVEHDELRASCPAMQEVLARLQRAAAHSVPVLLAGGRGTPREALARHLHRHGPRAEGPFRALSCAAIAASDVERALFSDPRRAGLLESAEGGTLFLDDVDLLPRAAQRKLAAFLEDRALSTRAGARRVDVRLVAGTSADLRAQSERGAFEPELLLRLALVVAVPALSERRADVPRLAATALARARAAVGAPVEELSPDALEALVAHAWPGNDRELELVLLRAALLCDGRVVGRAHLPAELGGLAPPRSASQAPRPGDDDAPILSFDAYEERALRAAIEQTGGNVTQAAKVLGIGRATIYRKLKKLGLLARGDDGADLPSDGE